MKCEVGDLAELVRGVSYDKAEVKSEGSKGYVPILRATNIDQSLDFDELVFVPNRFVSDEQMLRSGDIIIAASSGSKSVVGKAAQFSGTWKGSFGAFCKGIRPFAPSNPRYLGYFFQSPDYRRTVSRLASGSNINNLKREHISQLSIDLPPQGEQGRIVEKLDEYLSDLDAGTAALERARANLKRYRAAVLKAAVEGRLTEKWRAAHPDVEPAEKLLERILAERRKKWEEAQLKKFAEKKQAPPKGWKDKYSGPVKPDVAELPKLPEGWCWATFSQLGELDRGKSKHRPRNAAHLYGGPYPFVQTGDVKAAGTFLHDYEQTYSAAGLKQSKLWPTGTLCITIAANIGESTILGIDACFPDSVVGFVPSSPISTRFIQLQLQAARRRIEAMAPATAQKNINLEVLYRVPIALAPESEQKRVVDEFDSIGSLEEQAGLACTTGLARAMKLRQSTLKRAFEGKLVPQDPKDEPAGELLARIRAEREAGKGLIGQGKARHKILKKIRTKTA